jgi:hypothetical protein
LTLQSPLTGNSRWLGIEAQTPHSADAKGNETEVPVDDWIDIGAFAKPANGKKYGDTLYRQRMHITRRNSTFTFRAARLPEKAGIDPFALLIDRIPDDNMKKVAVESGPTQQAQGAARWAFKVASARFSLVRTFAV